MRISRSSGGNHTGLFGRPTIFMAPADPGGSGSKTPEELEADDERRWNERFHKGSVEREKRFEAKMMKTIEGVLESKYGAKFDELRQLLVESPEEPTGREPEREREGGAAKLSSEAEASIRQARKEAAEAKAMSEKWQNEVTAERQKASKSEERQQLVSLLNGKIKPAQLDMVVDHLHSKNITRDSETGAILWKEADGTTLPLKEAVTNWTKSDVGKEFAPPRGAVGTGSRGPTPEENALRQPGMDAEKLASIVLGSIPGQR
jgi:hypothetical protein